MKRFYIGCTWSKTTLLLVMMMLMSCSKKGIENGNHMVLPGKITSIEVSSHANLGDEITITVSFDGGSDGCAQPNHLRVVQDDYRLAFQAFYAYPKEPSICAQVIPRHKLTHTFKPHKRGTYKLFSAEDETILAEIKVN